MVTVIKTITEHTDGRVRQEDGTWKRRVGVEHVPHPDGPRRKPIARTVWQDCEPPKTYVYGSPEDKARAKRGGDVKYVVEGLPETMSVTLTQEEAEDLLRGYVHRFGRMTYIADGGKVLGAGLSEMAPTQAIREARRIAARVETLFGLDLWETNVNESMASS